MPDFIDLSDLLFWLRRLRGETTEVALRSHLDELDSTTGFSLVRKSLWMTVLIGFMISWVIVLNENGERLVEPGRMVVHTESKAR